MVKLVFVLGLIAIRTAVAIPACGRISDLVQDGATQVPAALAYECLQSVPSDRNDSLVTLSALTRILQWQSNLAYLKEPPPGYANPPCDVLGDITHMLDVLENPELYPHSKDYAAVGQYAFEQEVSTIFTKARDGHLNFQGLTGSRGPLRWHRVPELELVSVVQPDQVLPQVFLKRDLLAEGDAAAPVVPINGEAVINFLQVAADADIALHDPDARWNLALKGFLHPGAYPGPHTTLGWGYGLEQQFENFAKARDAEAWLDILDGQSFYDTFLKRDVPDNDLQSRDEEPLSSSNRPKIFVALDSTKRLKSGDRLLMMSNCSSDLAVLRVSSFDMKDNEYPNHWNAYQRFIREFLDDCSSKTSKLILDVSSNGGGNVQLPYELFKQLFPTIIPYSGNRLRTHAALKILIDNSKLYDDLYTESMQSAGLRQGIQANDTSYDHYFLDQYAQAFSSPQAFYGPAAGYGGDNYTSIFRLNLSDPDWDGARSIGFNLTGYFDTNTSEPMDQPFDTRNMMLLSNGVCESACAMFMEFMHQAGVRSIAIGGRPQLGPMQPVGGTKGSLITEYSSLLRLAERLLPYAPATQEQAWRDALDLQAGTIFEASVNSLDMLREGGDVPLQFINETADCRI